MHRAFSPSFLWTICLRVVVVALAAPSFSRGAEARTSVTEVTLVGGGKPGFTRVAASVTGVDFTNQLAGDAFLTNAVAHNGAGVAVGDVDGDGKPDIYLCNLQGPNRLYRNLGQWQFKEMSIGDAACPGQFSTGAVLADVDGDGDLDLLVNGIAAGTRVFLNDGKGTWAEVNDSGLSRTASATSMALADIDGDGDLDLYCTHFTDIMFLSDPTTRFAMARKGDRWEVTKVNGESTRAPKWKGRFEALPDGKVRELPEVHGLYRNEGGGHFKSIENEPGVYQDERGAAIPPFRDWGLAVMFRDINRDGVPDLYVCNDNTSPDRIWINNGNGTFRAIETWRFRHTSRSSMGVDFADFDRDGYEDLFVVDMLAREHAKRVTQLVRDRPNPLDVERLEERPQFNRNTLFFGRPDGSFVEAAFMAGLAASDWTWTTIFLDVDLDGYEDLLATNGFEFDVMDQDSQDLIKEPRRYTEAQLKRSMQFRPRWHTRNAAFRNRGDGTFEPAGAQWRFDHPGVSFGMATGDLDGDGDLDLVVNNLNEAAALYRNDAPGARVAVRLQGLPPNIQGISARVELVGGAMRQGQEMISGGRYLSGDQVMRTFAVDPDGQAPMRLEVRWRNGSRSTVSNVVANRIYEISEPPASRPAAPGLQPAVPEPLFADVSALLGHAHAEVAFDDWSRQPLLPRRLSRLGPGVAWQDLDGDGWEDLMLPSGRNGRMAVRFNQRGASFRRAEVATEATGDQGAVLAWADGRGGRQIVVAMSNQESPGEAPSELVTYAATNLAVVRRTPFGSASPGPMAVADIDGDGDLDWFVGGRFQPGRYPEAVSSAVWINQNGTMVPGEAQSAPFRSVGLVSGATFADLDGDGAPDLALALEWGPVRLFHNERGVFKEVTSAWGLADQTGWWTSVVAGDFDGDGRMDLACGNWGRNSFYELYQPTALRLFHGDWLSNGTVQMIEAWQGGTNWYPVRDRAWLSHGLPELPLQITTHAAFGRATVREILGPAYVKAGMLEARQLASAVFLNRGGRFELTALPREAQLAPVFGLSVGDVDGDGVEDLFCSQNFFGANSDLSRDDAGRGLWLKGTGRANFAALDATVSGIRVLGEQRGAALADFNHDGRVDLVVAQNNAETKLYANRGARRGFRVALVGPPGNPDGVGGCLRLVYGDGTKGPGRAVQAGSGYWSQDAPVHVLGGRETPVALWIRWPGGREQTVPIRVGEWNLRVELKE